MRPKLKLFDEPTSVLDPELVSEASHIVRGLAGRDMTIIVVTHEVAFVREARAFLAWVL